MEKFYDSDNDDNFDKIFRDKLFDFDANPQPGAFEKIFEKTSRKKKNYFGLKVSAVIFLVTILTFGVILTLKKEDLPHRQINHIGADKAINAPEKNIKISENRIAIDEKIEKKSDENEKLEAKNKPVNFSSKPVSSVISSQSTFVNSLQKKDLDENNLPKIKNSTKKLRTETAGKTANSLTNSEKTLNDTGEKSTPEVDIFKDIALKSEFPKPHVRVLSVQTADVFTGMLSAKNSETKPKRKNLAIGKSIFAGFEAGYSANIITADVNLPENVTLEKYSLKTIASRQIGVLFRTSLTHKLSLTATAKHFFIHEQAYAREASSKPDDFVRKKTGDLNLDCSPVFRYEDKSYTFKADYLKIGIGIRHDKEISPTVSRFFALQINHLRLLHEHKQAQTPSISSAGKRQLSETVMVKNLFSSEIQGGLLFSLNSRSRLSVAASVTNFASPFTRGAQEITMQNIALNVGFEVKLR